MLMEVWEGAQERALGDYETKYINKRSTQSGSIRSER